MDQSLTPIISKYINQEAERITYNIVNTSVNEIMTEYLVEDLIIIKKNTQDEIQLISYDTQKVNILLKQVNKEISKKLSKLENGNIKDFPISNDLKIGNLTNKKQGLVFEIPMGSLKNTTLFAHIGPVIPIKMNFIGQINTNLRTNLKTYGINTVAVELYVEAEIKERATMPISTENKIIKIKAPLAIQIIQGNIPSYYFDNIDKISQNATMTLS